jgi:hypothetical protein
MWANLWMTIRIYVVCAGIAAVISTGTYFLGRHDGSSDCQVKQANAVLKEVTTERKNDAKRDSQKPSGADRAANLKWLRQYVSP